MNDAMNEDVTDDMDALLDMELDDIEDLPEFKPFPGGCYAVAATMEQKKIGEHSCIELALKLVSVQEMVDPSEVPPAEGDEASVLYMLDNEFGLGKLKVVAKQFAEFAGSEKLRDIVNAVKDVQCMVITGIRKDKNDTSKKYMDIKEIAVQ